MASTGSSRTSLFYIHITDEAWEMQRTDSLNFGYTYGLQPDLSDVLFFSLNQEESLPAHLPTSQKVGIIPDSEVWYVLLFKYSNNKKTSENHQYNFWNGTSQKNLRFLFRDDNARSHELKHVFNYEDYSLLILNHRT